MALAALLQHRAHHAAQMAPVRRGSLRQQRVAAGAVDGVVEGEVGVDHGVHVSAGHGHATALQQGRVEHRVPGRGQPRGQRVERSAHLVDLAHALHVQRRHLHPAAWRVLHETVVLELAQRLQHRLARHRHLRRNVFLRQPLAGGQRAVADGAQQHAVDLIHAVGRAVELDEMGVQGRVAKSLYTEYRAPAWQHSRVLPGCADARSDNYEAAAPAHPSPRCRLACTFCLRPRQPAWAAAIVRVTLVLLSPG